MGDMTRGTCIKSSSFTQTLNSDNFLHMDSASFYHFSPSFTSSNVLVIIGSGYLLPMSSATLGFYSTLLNKICTLFMIFSISNPSPKSLSCTKSFRVSGKGSSRRFSLQNLLHLATCDLILVLAN